MSFLLLYSGGVDSSVLLHSLLEVYPYPDRVHVLHVDYALRGNESRREVEGIKKICRKKKVTLHQFICSLSYLKNESGNLQAKAREFRYQKATKIAICEGINHIFTAHHRDDNLETFFAKLLKGQSPASLAGVIEKKNFRNEVDIVHPFSRLAKRDLEAYAHQYAVPFFVDSSNAEDDYERNYLRRRIFPLLDSKFPTWRENMTDSMGYLTQANRLFKESQTWICQTPILPILKNKKINVLGFVLNPDFEILSKEDKKYLLHYGLSQHFPLRRFSRDEIRAVLGKIGGEDKKLFTYHLPENSARSYGDKYEVVWSRGWVAPLIIFGTSGDEVSDFVIELKIKRRGMTTLLWKTKIRFSWPGKIIFIAPNSSPKKEPPHHSISINLPEINDLPRSGEWNIRPLSDYKKSQRVGSKTIKKHIEAKKLPAPVRSALMGLSCNGILLGAIDLWGYRYYSRYYEETEPNQNQDREFFISFI